MMCTRNPTVIIANGEPPVHAEALQRLRSAQILVCCDGAIAILDKLGLMPSVVVGDMDSITPGVATRFGHCLQMDTNPNYNDLTKALRYCLSRDLREVTILGATGLREDHTLGNIGVMLQYAKEYKMKLEMLTNHGIFTPAFQSITLPSFQGQQVSVFSITSHTLLSYKGLKYPVLSRTFHYWSEGCLNEALSDEFSVLFEDGEVLIFRMF
ncbi:MAG: thiamine diphosphokinase [Bacteroidales bacterium]|nr:thiamine diphosphokinase [Bacteroidales bacterium]